jgi:hypothetical protein
MLEIKENTSSKQMANEPKSRGKKPKQKAERANESNSKLSEVNRVPRKFLPARMEHQCRIRSRSVPSDTCHC